uniref:Not1 domain-containing protein n=1 Tax=Macrostomum lignano TaxID=282301 RepID=A0A1I8H4Q9_9PLAT
CWNRCLSPDRSLTNSSTATVSPGEAAATAALSMSLTPPLLRRPAAKQLLQDRFPSLAASYIEPFQLVVVAAMRMYMAPCDQASQSAVLDLFCTLMLLGTNYSSLDRQSTFLTYLLRQLETAATSAPAGPLGRAPLRPLFAFLCSLSQHDPGLLPSARLLQLADSLLAVGWQCQDALGPIIDDLFGRQPAATAAAAATPESHQLLESQREFAANLLLRQPANCLTLLPAPLYLSRRQSEERWLRQSRSVADVLLQQLGTGTLPVDRLDQLRSLDTVLAACSPAALRPTDVPLGLLFLPMLPSTTASAPSIATFGRWLAAVLAGVRLLLAQPEEAVLPRLAGLEVPPPPIQAFVELVATSPSATSPMPRSDEQTLGIQLVSVLAAVLEELANSRQSATVSVASSSEPTANSDDAATATAFVADGGTLLLLYLCHLTAGYRRLGAFCRRSDIVAALNSRVAPLVTTQPRLVIVYCYLLTRWGYFEEDWWLRMLRPSESADDYNVRLCKRGALCVLADWTASDGDGEKFSWLIPNFLADIVNDSRRYEELHRLVSAVHRNRLASEMLVYLHPPSGPLLAVRRRAESVVISRLNMLEGAGATAAFSVDDAADALRRAQQRRLTGLVAAMKRYLGNRGARSPNSAAPAAPAAGSPTVAVAVACNADPLTSGVNADDEDSASAAAEKDEADSRAWFANWTADWCLSDSGSAAAAVSGVVGARLLWHLDSAALAKVMSDSRFRLHHLESCIRLASSASAAALTSSALRQRRPASATSTDGGQGQLLAACQAALLKRLLKSSDGAGDATAAAASAASTGSTVAGSADGAAEAETSPAVRWCLGACWLALLSARTSDQIVDSQLSDANIAKQLWRLVARLLSDSAAPGARSRARDSVRLALACARRPGLLTCLAADAQLADRLPTLPRRVDPCLAAADAVAAAAGAADASHPERRRLSRLIGLAASDAASSHGLDDELLLLCVALARLPHYNESLRVPEEAAVQDGVHVELGALKDPRVLQEVVTRCALLGWTSRQQFEETWVSLISVLNPAVGFDEPERLDPEEEVESTQCKLLAVRAISRLLLDTLTDWPGDPVRRQLYHWPRPLAAPRLNCPPDPSDLCQGDIVNLERIGDVLAYNLNQIAVKKLRDRANNSGAGSGASQLDTRSCLQFLMDLFHSWLRSSNLSNQLLAETVKCCVLVSDLLSDLGHLDWLSGHLSELAAQHPHEDSQTWFYIWAGLGKTQALLLSNQLAANQSTPAAAAGSSTAVGDSPPAAEQVALVAQSWTRLEPALRQLGQADCPLMQMGALHAALYLLQCRPAPSQEALAPLVAFLEAEVANLALSSRRSERLALLALSAAFQVAPLYDDVTSALVSATAKLCASPRLNYFVQACCSHGWQRLVEQAAVPQAALQTLIAKVALSPRGPGLCHLTPSLALLVASLAKCPESAALERVDSACRLLAKAADPIEGLLWSRALPPLMLRLFGRQAALNKALNLFLTARALRCPDSMSIAAAANASPTSPAAPAGTTVASSVSGGSGCTSSQLMTELVMPSLSALLAKLAKPWPA